MTKEKRLGRGLEALLGRSTKADPPARPAEPAAAPAPADNPYPPTSEAYPAMPDLPLGSLPPMPADFDPTSQFGSFGPLPALSTDIEPPASGPMQVSVRLIDSNPFQPRQEFDEGDLQALCDSIRAHGLLQPIVVRTMGERYQLIAGERRLRAATKAGWTDVPVQIVEADDRQVAELAIVENMQRKDLNPLEKATSFQRYLEQYGCTQEELAARLKLDRSTISNLIRLLELPGKVQDALRQGKITQGHARSLLPLGDEREQLSFCRRIQEEGLSVRQTESLVQETIDQADAEPLSVVGRDGDTSKSKRSQSDHVAALEQEFRSALGLKLVLKHNARGRGKLVIQFRNHEEFERLREAICGSAKPKVRAG